MNFLYGTYAHSCTMATASAKTLTLQGQDPNSGRNVRKDIANSAPGVIIENTGIRRTEVKNGVTYDVIAVTFKQQKQSTDGTKTVDMSATMTFRVPQAIIANSDIRTFAENLIMLLWSNGTTGTAGVSTDDSQLVKILLGTY